MIKRSLAILTAITLASLTACAVDDGAASGPKDGEPLRVVATFSIIGDIVTAIGGDNVEVHSIVPLGVDPHEYSPLSKDVQKSTESDVMFWNGLNMEVGGGWFEALTEVADKDMESEQVIEVARDVEPMYLSSEDGSESEINPHAFLSPQVGISYAKTIRDGLIANDPDNEDFYHQNAEEYLAELDEIDQMYRDNIADIPEENRVFVASEYAFQYMTEEYGLTPGFIWEIDTDEQGTPEQINNLIALVRETGVTALFVESNVDRRPMETISAETGVPIDGMIYSDELGTPESTGRSYIEMLKHNITVIHKGLSS